MDFLDPECCPRRQAGIIERNCTLADRYLGYERLQFDRPHPRVLRITMHNPGRLNSADATMHRELVEIWRDIDADAGVSATILTDAGNAFPAGRDFDIIGTIMYAFSTRAPSS